MTPEQARARIAKLEALADQAGPLNAADQAELCRLEAAYALFPPIDDMTMAELDAYMAWHASADAGRLDQLRRRTLSSQR